MTFWGRIEEKKKIQRVLQKKGQGNCLIYGRRRVGKSELIKQCLKEYHGLSIYYECKQTTEMNNVDSLSVLISEKMGFPKLAFSSIEDVLAFIFKAAKAQPIILVLDEYPYLRDSVKGLDSILQHLIDAYHDDSHAKLILCGSFMETMKALLLVQNPLYGRMDAVLDLKPMNYRESALFYPTFSDEDKVRLYSVFGGIPYYNRLIDETKTVKENIIDLIASPGARLESEVSMYLKSELSKVTNANEVFETLAKGYSRYKDILSQSHISSGPTLIDVLERLIKMDVVKKEAPINDEGNKKKTGYYISDNLSLFFYTYIFPYLSQLNVMNPSVFYDTYIRESFEMKYVPRRFEEICKQYLIMQNRAGKWNRPFYKIGKYYYDDPKTKQNGEFDIVTEDGQGYVFYEAKFRTTPITGSMVKKEIEQVRETTLQCHGYGFFSRSGFTADIPQEVIQISLHQLYV